MFSICVYVTIMALCCALLLTQCSVPQIMDHTFGLAVQVRAIPCSRAFSVILSSPITTNPLAITSRRRKRYPTHSLSFKISRSFAFSFEACDLERASGTLSSPLAQPCICGNVVPERRLRLDLGSTCPHLPLVLVIPTRSLL